MMTTGVKGYCNQKRAVCLAISARNGCRSRTAKAGSSCLAFLDFFFHCLDGNTLVLDIQPQA
jgi:hypothetical protein